MSGNKEKILRPHSLSLSLRKELRLSGISNVDSFNEEVIIAYTDYGELVIKGQKLKMENLNVESGDLFIKGEINSLVYNNSKKGKSKFSKIFK